MRINDKGIYLLYMQLNLICSWIQKTKIKAGFGEKKPFLVDKNSLDDVNYYINVLQAAVSREREIFNCGNCFPVLKYNFSNVVAPDPDGNCEEGKSSFETYKKCSDKRKLVKKALEELVVHKNEGIGSMLFFGSRRNGAKVFSALKINSDNL
jgi:hypothetical protein